MSKISLLASADGIKLSTNHIANGDDFDKIVDSISSLFVTQCIEPTNTASPKAGKRLSEPDHIEAIRIILSCLFFEWSHSTRGHHKCVRYYRNKSGYANTPLSFIITLRVIDWLGDNDYIEMMQGYFYGDGTEGKMSRIRPKPKLSNKFIDISRPQFKFDSDIDIINIRDSDKKDGIDVTSISVIIDNLMTHGSDVSNLEKQRVINKVRLKHIFTLSSKKLFVVTPLYRIFNNSRFGDGGRFYGSEEQQLPKDMRKTIRINYKPTVERDFKNLHIKMLYDLIGEKLTTDSYQIHFSNGDNYDRSFMKVAVLIMFNASTEKSARMAIQEKIRKGVFKSIYSAKDVIQDIKNKHQPISKYFGSGEGIRLQNIDSEIALEVMYHFAVKDIPCLCIHDSFIVDIDYQDELDKIMKEKYCQVMKFKQFRMRSIGKDATHPNMHWNTYLAQTPDSSFMVEVD